MGELICSCFSSWSWFPLIFANTDQMWHFYLILAKYGHSAVSHLVWVGLILSWFKQNRWGNVRLTVICMYTFQQGSEHQVDSCKIVISSSSQCLGKLIQILCYVSAEKRINVLHRWMDDLLDKLKEQRVPGQCHSHIQEIIFICIFTDT